MILGSRDIHSCVCGKKTPNKPKQQTRILSQKKLFSKILIKCWTLTERKHKTDPKEMWSLIYRWFPERALPTCNLYKYDDIHYLVAVPQEHF